MTDAPVPGSFRDPSGFVFRRDGVVLRQVNASYADDYDLLLSSGLYDALTDAGLLLPHAELDVADAPEPGAHRLLRPEQLGFVSHPYEWCFSQLKAAALATLRIQSVALDHGMSLRDASAYNIQFRGTAPVLIDTLSFEALPDGEPWVAYRQFCQHFLAPLALESLVDVRLGQLLRIHLDGVPLDLASRLLPAGTRLRPSLSLHLHAHAKSQRRHAGDATGRAGGGRFSLQAFRGLIDSLSGAVKKLTWNPQPSEWVDYYAAGQSYGEDAAEHKRELVAKLLGELSPAVVWDFGANTGRFSRVAAETGALVVALEMDPSSVEASWREAVAAGEERILPLVLDLSNPSPALGWAHAERQSLAERGPADVVLALALVHHLAIANNVPLERIADHFADLGRWLLIEFVPKADPMVQRLLASRQDVFPGYTEEGFEAAFGDRFDIDRRERLRGSERTLYLLRRR